jgi:hypothetical protein
VVLFFPPTIISLLRIQLPLDLGPLYFAGFMHVCDSLSKGLRCRFYVAFSPGLIFSYFLLSRGSFEERVRGK